jgi:hypothetical protein
MEHKERERERERGSLKAASLRNNQASSLFEQRAALPLPPDFSGLPQRRTAGFRGLRYLATAVLSL